RSVRSLGSCGDCWPLSVLSYVLYQKSLLQGHPRIYRGNVSACDLGESHKTNRDVTFDESPGNCTRGNALSTFLQWMYDENTEDVKRQHSFIGMSNEKGSDIAKHIHIQSYPCMGHNVPYWIPFLVGPATGLLFAISTVIIILLLIRKKSVRDSLFKNEATRRSQDNSNENSAMRRIRLETVVVRNDEELVLGEAIGKGTFSEVYSGTWKKMTVAVKKISNDTKKIKTEWLEREISLMRHPNIVLFLFATVQPHYIYIVTELCSRGSLYDIIHDGSEMDLMLQMRLATDAARGMLHLHSMEPKIIHRDLKSSNLLVDKDWNLKVSDFGISVALDSQRMLTGNCGTVEYMAPECLMNTVYTEKCDVYSYGVVLAELFNRQDLYPDMSVVQIRFQVRTQHLRPSVEGIPIPIRELIENCWQTEPNLRPSFDTIVSVLTEVVQSPQLLHTRTNAMKRKTKNYAKSVPRFIEEVSFFYSEVLVRFLIDYFAPSGSYLPSFHEIGANKFNFHLFEMMQLLYCNLFVPQTLTECMVEYVGQGNPRAWCHPLT
ncbi:serine/threonine protein kinase, partial [Planoprotostelium fungivorum]